MRGRAATDMVVAAPVPEAMTVLEAGESRVGSGGLVRALAAAWLVAGTLDIGVAIVYYGITAHVAAVLLLQNIASGILGASAFHGGVATALLGLACHYFIALVWTTLFFVVYPRIPLLAWSRVATAVLYAVVVSVVMSFVVVPASRVARRPFHLQFFLIATLILVFTIGLPLSILARRYYAGRAAAP